jgi:hypothetical protein
VWLSGDGRDSHQGWMWLNWYGRGQQPGMEVTHNGRARLVARNGSLGWVKLGLEWMWLRDGRV